MLFLENKICFIHIPKTAGKFLREYLKNHSRVLIESWNCLNDLDYAHVPLSKISYIYNETFLQQFKFITVVRNPIERFISAFYYLNESNHPLIRNMEINQFIQLHLEKLLEKSEGFSKDIVHFIPQYLFINKKNTFELDERVEIIQYEDLKQGIAKYFRTPLHYKYKGYQIPRILSVDSVKILERIYTKDFELLGYPKIIDESKM